MAISVLDARAPPSYAFRYQDGDFHGNQRTRFEHMAGNYFTVRPSESPVEVARGIAVLLTAKVALETRDFDCAGFLKVVCVARHFLVIWLDNRVAKEL